MFSRLLGSLESLYFWTEHSMRLFSFRLVPIHKVSAWPNILVWFCLLILSGYFRLKSRRPFDILRWWLSIVSCRCRCFRRCLFLQFRRSINQRHSYNFFLAIEKITPSFLYKIIMRRLSHSPLKTINLAHTIFHEEVPKPKDKTPMANRRLACRNSYYNTSNNKRDVQRYEERCKSDVVMP